MAETLGLPERPSLLSRRSRLVLGIGLAAAASWVVLGLSPAALVPNQGGLEILWMFLRGAVQPAWTYQSDFVPPGTEPLPLKVLVAVRTTVVFAVAGMSLSLLIGLTLGFLGATSWWSQEPCRRASPWQRLRCYAMPAIYGVVRILIALMRSVHELLWAVLFLAAFGLNSFSAVVAIAIPYGGTLAKVFSEMLDEAPRDSAESLRAIGARPLQVFTFGLLPRALPDAAAYSFYRLECAVRSSAILGFFGYPTLGYYLRLSAENLHYREVWTYLYALLAVVLLLELWSMLLRKRLVVR